MDYSFSYHEIDTIKLEKQKAMQRYNTFKKITNIVRTLEIIVAISMIFYAISYFITFSTSYLPTLMEISSVYLRRLSSLIFCPHFVFFVGNTIIIILYAKSKTNINDESSDDGEIFGETIKTQYIPTEIIHAKPMGILTSKNLDDGEIKGFNKATATTMQYDPTTKGSTPIIQDSPIKVEPQDNSSRATTIQYDSIELGSTPIIQYGPTKVKPQENSCKVTTPIQYGSIKVESSVIESSESTALVKSYRRTKSSSEMVVAKAAEVEKELRRSKTEVRREEESPVAVGEEDELSNEEFRKRVEEFIAKQQRLLREEKLAVIISN